jgi:tRNA threonylcarbamoyladenosine biosynthesis protein TsaE
VTGAGTTAPPRRAPEPVALTRDEMVAWGERFGRAVRAPHVVAISGELGAGKTTLVQAIGRGAGITEEVTSPTFALVHEYAAPAWPVYHLDLFRIERPDELTNIGWDEIVTAHALVLIEWPERAGPRLPADAVAIALAYDLAHPERRLLRAG